MTILVTTRLCPVCHKSGEVAVDRLAYQLWREGMLIQRAMPNMSADEREQLITGTHPNCWDAMFGNDDDGPPDIDLSSQTEAW